MKEILAPISLGELIDKITILQIKKANLESQPLINVERELALLTAILNKLSLNVDQTTFDKLRAVNQDLWDIEDAICYLEKAKISDPTSSNWRALSTKRMTCDRPSKKK